MNRSNILSKSADVIIYLFMAFMIAITLYPVLYIFSVSISDPLLVLQNKIVLIPKGINVRAYENVLSNSAIWHGLVNSIFLITVGTAINVIITILAAFPISRKSFFWRNKVSLFIAFTMFFNGGMIPTYVVVSKLGLLDSIWALIIPSACGAFNVIIMKTFFETIPDSLEESAKMDGGTDITVLLKIFIPLSTPVIAVITLFYAVGHWNEFVQALIYLRTASKYPLQLVLRQILLMNQMNDMVADQAASDLFQESRAVQYATIVISIIPMLIIYPFLQRYFVKGIMIGAIKE